MSKCIYSYEDGDYCLKHSHGAADVHCTGEDGCPDFATGTKAEYIEREAANEALRECVRAYPNSFYNGIEVARSAIRKLPTADVVPVVRCKDCKHSYEDLCGRVCSYGVSVDCVVPDDFFCADGAKMDGGKE